MGGVLDRGGEALVLTLQLALSYPQSPEIHRHIDCHHTHHIIDSAKGRDTDGAICDTY